MVAQQQLRWRQCMQSLATTNKRSPGWKKPTSNQTISWCSSTFNFSSTSARISALPSSYRQGPTYLGDRDKVIGSVDLPARVEVFSSVVHPESTLLVVCVPATGPSGAQSNHLLQRSYPLK